MDELQFIVKDSAFYEGEFNCVLQVIEQVLHQVGNLGCRRRDVGHLSTMVNANRFIPVLAWVRDKLVHQYLMCLKK